MVKSFMTNMPDQCGAFLAASRIIERHQGNIVRVSYNKAVMRTRCFWMLRRTTRCSVPLRAN